MFRVEKPAEELPSVFEPVHEVPVEPTVEAAPDPVVEPPAPSKTGGAALFSGDDLPALEPEPLDVDLDREPGRQRFSESDFSVGVDAPEEAQQQEEDSEWVFETEATIDPGTLEIEPLETDESTLSDDQGGNPFFGSPPVVEAEAPEPAPEPADEPAVSGFSFGKRDPKEKARRLARVLVSDMIMYNPERHERALANGTLREDFEDEIAKSWREYVDQVGEEMANGNPFWTDALNDVLAKGQQVF